jgi:hypothetical protein
MAAMLEYFTQEQPPPEPLPVHVNVDLKEQQKMPVRRTYVLLDSGLFALWLRGDGAAERRAG